MKTIKLFLILTVIWISTLSVHAVQADTTTQGDTIMKNLPKTLEGALNSDELEAFSDAFMAERMPEMNIPGSLVVIVRGDEILLSKGYGYANLEKQIPLTPETYIRPASLAKTFAFTALLQLYDQGKIQLDGDVNQSLQTPLKDMGTAPVTPHHLLTHTDGFEDRTLGIAAWLADETIPIQTHFYDNEPGRVAPGEMITYGNWGAVFSSVLVEQLSGQSFADYTGEHIFAPLGMVQTTFVQPKSKTEPVVLAEEYSLDEGAPQTIELVLPRIIAGGGITSSAADMGVFMMMLLQGGVYGGERVLQEETVAMMMNRQFTTHTDLPGTTYAFMEHFENGQRAVRRDGYGMESRSRIMFIPEQNLGVFIYYNVGENELRNAFFDDFMDTFYPVASLDLTASAETSDAGQNGYYVAVQTDNSTYGKLQMLFAGMQKFEHNSDGTATLTPVNFDAYGGIEEESHWLETSPSFYERTDEAEGRIAFTERDGKRILNMGTGMLGAYRQLTWFETPMFQSFLTGAILLVFMVTWVTGAIGLKRALGAGNTVGRVVPLAWGLALLISVAAIAYIFVVSYAIFVKGGALPMLPAYVFEPNGLVKATLGFSWLIVALIVALAVAVGLLWSQDVAMKAKVYLTLVTFCSLAFVWMINYWNLLGYRY